MPKLGKTQCIVIFAILKIIKDVDLVSNAMHELDLSTVDCIVFETFPNEGLGLTMNDKLQRATTPKK